MTHLAAFLGLSALVIVTPGPDTALTIRNALAGGRRAGAATAFGVALGQLVWTLAASLGVAALLRAWAPAFTAIRFAGALYLVALGVRALRDALRRAPRAGEPLARPLARRLSAVTAFRQGVINNLGNPKMAVFFTSLLPQFTRGARAAFPELLLLGLMFCGLTLVWLSLYAVAVARAGDALRRPAVRRALDGLVGAALVGFGLRLATERR